MYVPADCRHYTCMYSKPPSNKLAYVPLCTTLDQSHKETLNIHGMYVPADCRHYTRMYSKPPSDKLACVPLL